MLCLRWHKFSLYFSILNGVKIKITHSIAPVNLQSSIYIAGVSRWPNVCPIVLSSYLGQPIFRNTAAIVNSMIAWSAIPHGGRQWSRDARKRWRRGKLVISCQLSGSMPQFYGSQTAHIHRIKDVLFCPRLLFSFLHRLVLFVEEMW